MLEVKGLIPIREGQCAKASMILFRYKAEREEARGVLWIANESGHHRGIGCGLLIRVHCTKPKTTDPETPKALPIGLYRKTLGRYGIGSR